MKRSVYRCEGSSVAGLRLIEEDLSAPQPHEVQIAVKTIGLNFADIFAILGLYEAAPNKPFIPGLEYAGVVESVGEKVSDFNTGDRVMGVTFFGAYTTALNVDSRFVRRMPTDWSFEHGAAHLVASLTAYYGLIDQCRLRKGETVLIQSAAGGVGLAALAIAKKYECFAIGAIGRAEKQDFCLKQGYDSVIVRDSSFQSSLRKALGKRELNVVMEAIGGKTFRDSFALLAPRGRIAIYGFAEYMPQNLFSYVVALWRYVRRPRVDTLRLNNRLIGGFNLIYLFSQADDIKKYADEIDALDIGKPYIGEVFPMEKLPAALEALKSGKTVGKIVVSV